jgi:hypothetical protein
LVPKASRLLTRVILEVRCGMTRKAMNKVALVSGILCVVLAVVIFVFAHGLRRWYSGIFFAILGTFMLGNALRWRRAVDE